MRIKFRLGAGSTRTLLRLDQFNSDPAFREWKDIVPEVPPVKSCFRCGQSVVRGNKALKWNCVASQTRKIQIQAIDFVRTRITSKDNRVFAVETNPTHRGPVFQGGNSLTFVIGDLYALYD
jgi:hypothetical protein